MVYRTWRNDGGHLIRCLRAAPIPSGSIVALLTAVRTARFAGLLRLASSATGGASASEPSRGSLLVRRMRWPARGLYVTGATPHQPPSSAAIPSGSIGALLTSQSSAACGRHLLSKGGYVRIAIKSPFCERRRRGYETWRSFPARRFSAVFQSSFLQGSTNMDKSRFQKPSP